jgi:hypothetical protein
MKLDKKIKKKLLETKEQKDRLIIEQEIVRSRIMMIFESQENIENWENLSEEKKFKISCKFLQEISFQQQNGVINEQFMDIIKSIFGSSIGGGFAQAVLEPAVSWILSGLGMESNSYIKKFVVSFLTKKEGFWNYLKDCRTLTRGIAESLAEAVAIQVQQGTNTGGFWMDAIRNVLGDWISHTGFVEGIEKQIGDKICGYWDKATGNAKNVLTKLKGEESVSKPEIAATTTATPTTPATSTTAVFPTGK